MSARTWVLTSMLVVSIGWFGWAMWPIDAHVEKAVVLGRQYDPPSTYITYDYTYDSKGNITGTWPRTVYVPPNWSLIVQLDEVRTVGATREAWELAQVGQVVPVVVSKARKFNLWYFGTIKLGEG